jgi:DNA mismatch repair protein MutS
MNAPLKPESLRPDAHGTAPQGRAEPVIAPGTTPVMAQFLQVKAAHPDALVFFRMGDFYELFFEDAERAAAVLGLALTKRGKHLGEDIPMAGVPVHAAEGYMARLIRAGLRVAVCEQVEDPAEARKRGSKAVVRREVVRVVTPGTLTEDSLLDPKRSSLLAAVVSHRGRCAIAVADLSSGRLECLACAPADLATELAAFAPSELLVADGQMNSEELAPLIAAARARAEPALQALHHGVADVAAHRNRLERLYGVLTLDGFGDFSPAEVSAMGLIGAYIELTQAGRVPALKPPRRHGESPWLAIDAATRTSLEIERNTSGGREGSLVDTLDRTLTAAGSRALLDRLARPLRAPEAINARLDQIEALLSDSVLRQSVREHLRGCADIQRALSRLALARGGPRDLKALALALSCARELSNLTHGAHGALASLAHSLTLPDAITALLDDLSRALVDEPAHNLRDGGFIATGYRPDLDETRALRDDSRRIIAALEGEAQSETGLPLKVRHNAVLGYFFETTARHGESLMREPLNARYFHRQTLASQVRFTTRELSELDARISKAAATALAIEIETFEALRERAIGLNGALQRIADALAEIDVAAGLAEWAEDHRAVRPLVDDSLCFHAEGARHPVVEAALRREARPFTANDCRLDASGEQGARLIIVTGPNMAGKSTFLRQNALLVVMAQAGCFVPAVSLRLGVADRLFSRVGAGDDLASGRSTFMMEMVETAAILTQASERSFVVLDEIGRGTATWDGLAIAHATAEALHERNRARTLFATHYHELATLDSSLSSVANLSMRAREWNGDLVFLHEAAPGAADRSYGVQVARLAGVPHAVVERARQVLERLESSAGPTARLDDLPLFAVAEPAPAILDDRLHKALADLDPDALSPRDALDALYRLKSLLS